MTYGIEETVLPEDRVGLGSLLAATGRRIKLTDDELADFVRRDNSPGQVIDLEQSLQLTSGRSVGNLCALNGTER